MYVLYIERERAMSLEFHLYYAIVNLNFIAVDPEELRLLEVGSHHGRFDVVSGYLIRLQSFSISVAFFHFRILALSTDDSCWILEKPCNSDRKQRTPFGNTPTICDFDTNPSGMTVLLSQIV